MWIELHDTARDHPKILKLARDLEINPVQALGHMVSLWTWTLRMAPDGNLESFDSDDIELGAQWGGRPGVFIEAATSRGLLNYEDGVFHVHDWEDFAGSLKACGRARSYRVRKAEQRRGCVKSSRDSTVPSRDGHVIVCDSTQTDQTRPDQTDQTRPVAPSCKSISPQTASPIEISIPVQGGEYPVTEDQVEEWAAAFPAVDVSQSLRSIKQWCVANPERKKTPRGVVKFIVAWLTKDQDKPHQSTRQQQPFMSRQDQAIAASRAAVEEYNARVR